MQNDFFCEIKLAGVAAGAVAHLPGDAALVDQNALMKSICNSQFPHKIANLFFILVIIKGRLTDLGGN